MRTREINHEYKNRLYELREEQGLGQKEVASAINIHQTTLSKYELSTSQNIPLDVLCKLADFYNTSIDYILMRTNNRESDSSK